MATWDYQTQGAPQSVLDYFKGYNPGITSGAFAADPSQMGGWFQSYLNRTPWTNFADEFGSQWMPYWEGASGASDSSDGSPGYLSGYRMGVGGLPGQTATPYDYYFNPQGQFSHSYTNNEKSWLNPLTGILGVAGLGLGASALFGGLGGAEAATIGTAGTGAAAAPEAAAIGTAGTGLGSAAGFVGEGVASGIPAWDAAFAAAPAAGGGILGGLGNKALGTISQLAGGSGTGGGGMAGNTTTVQRADPWVGIQPSLSALYSGALSNFYGPDKQYYPGSTVAPQSPFTTQAQQLTANRALTGSPVQNLANQQLQQTLSGAYFNNPASQGLQRFGEGAYFDPRTASGAFLNSNPYLDRMFGQAAENVGQQYSKNVMPGIASMFSGAGRYGSNAMTENIGQAERNYGQTLSNLATNIYGGNYAQERGLMEAAQQAQNAQRLSAFANLGDIFGRERAFQTQQAGFAPTLAAADYNDLSRLSQVGQQQEGYSQAQLNDLVNRFNFQQAQPQEKLAFLNQILQGGMGLNTTTTTQSQPRSALGGALGGAMLGSSIGQQFGTSDLFGGVPWGTLGGIGGAVLGGLFA